MDKISSSRKLSSRKNYRLVEGITFQKHFSLLFSKFYFIAIIAIIPVSFSLFLKGISAPLIYKLYL